MFNVEQNEDWLDLDIYGESNNGPIKFEMTGREKTISGEEALQISTMSSRQKRITENQQLLSPKRSNCLQVVLLVKMVKTIEKMFVLHL